jgi:hypothetical protein
MAQRRGTLRLVAVSAAVEHFLGDVRCAQTLAVDAAPDLDRPDP